MNQNNILKYLVPVVAVVVLLESLLLINNLRNKSVNNNLTVKTGQSQLQGIDPTTAVRPVSFDLAVLGSPSMKLKTASTVEVQATALELKSLDSVNVYLKYDPAAFEVTKMVFDKRLPSPTFSKASTTKGVVVVNFLISDPKGVQVKQGDILSLVKFEAMPKKTGNFDFEISTGNEAKESATMFVENATSEILPFTSNKLTVNVLR
jgi:hypothetical protein